MKKILAILCVALTCAALAHGPRGFHGRPGPYRPVPHHHHHHHHSSGWFWAGVGTGLLLDAVRPAPVVVRNPVWVPPTYSTVPVCDTYGRVIRYDRVLVTAGYWQY